MALFDTTSVFDRLLEAYMSGKRHVILQGGSSSSKTYSIIQLLIIIAINSNKKILISIVSETLPALKRGAFRDFKDIMGDTWNDNSWHKTDMIYTFDNGSIIEFFSADSSDRLKGPRRDILFINEVNNITKFAFDELDVRTRLFTILDFNPSCDFFLFEHAIFNQPSTYFFISTYLDAKKVLPQATIDGIEARKSDKNWYQCYGLGQLSVMEGLVHPDFEQIDNMPNGEYFYGMDTGYNDPTSLIKNCIIGKNLYSHEVIYQSRLVPADMDKLMLQSGVRKGYDVIYCDAADPMTIEDLSRKGWNIIKAKKGPDSVMFGINKVNEYKQYWTKDSVDSIKEQRNYKYLSNRSSGKLTDEPIDAFNHALDARRYAVTMYTANSQRVGLRSHY
jgi:phage terminase large subunit